MRRSTLPLRLQCLEDRCTPANVSWDGGGADLLWNNPLNWSNDLVPASIDSVTVSGAAGPVTLSGTGRTITALNLDNDLIVDGVGLSVSGGAMTIVAGRTLTTQSVGGTLSATGTVSMASAAVTAKTGASITLSGMTTLAAPTTSETLLSAEGASATLSLPNLTTVTGSFTAATRFLATTGGVISMPGLTKLDGGYSKVIATDSGVIQAPLLTTFDYSDVRFDHNLALPFSQFTSMKHTLVIGFGGTANFSSVTNLASSSVYLSVGAAVSFPAVTTLPASDAGETTFQASDPSSVLSFPNLTSLGASTITTYFKATNGGQVSIPSLASITNATVNLRSDGTGSMLVASSLATLTAPVNTFSFLVVKDGTLQVPAGLNSLDRVVLTLQGNATFPATQLTSVTNGEIDVISSTVTFTNLANINSTSLVTLNGTAKFPAAISSTAPQRDIIFQTSGAGARIELPNLATLGGDNSGKITYIQALNGGWISLPAITQLTAGKTDLYANAPNSTLDLPSLTTVNSPSPTFGSVRASTSGTINTAAALTVDRTDFSFNETGVYTLTSLSLGASATMTGAGTLKAAVVNSGIVRPVSNTGGAGVLTIDGKYTQTSTGQLAIDLGGTSVSQYDRLAVTGQASLDGSLAISLINGHVPSIFSAYLPVTCASRTGQFTGYSGLLQGGAELQPSYDTTGMGLIVIPPNGPTVTAMTPSGSVGSIVTFFDITFSEPMSAGSFGIGDVSIVGPAGPYSATSVTFTGPNTFRVNVTPLANQGSYTVTVGPNINDAAGNAMNQDGDGTFGEATDDRFNNLLAFAFPNLSVSSITGVPASANFGSSATLGWTVQNTGGGPASGTWTDRVWLSTDSVLDGTDVLLGSFPVTKTVASGGNYTSSGNVVTFPTVPFRADGSYRLIVQTNALNEITETNLGNNSLASSTIAMSNPPRVASVVINDGSAHRSRINALTINFSESVTITPPTAGAFTLTRTSGAGSPVTVPITATQTSPTQVTIGFTAGSEFVNGSLLDGNFTLGVVASKVSDGTLNLDGDSNGAPGDNFSFNFFCKYGDHDGNGTVLQSDFNAFRQAYLAGPSFEFDYDNDGDVDQAEFNEFRLRFNT